MSFPPPEDLPDPGIKLMSFAIPALAGGFFNTLETQIALINSMQPLRISAKFFIGCDNSKFFFNAELIKKFLKKIYNVYRQSHTMKQ